MTHWSRVRRRCHYETVRLRRREEETIVVSGVPSVVSRTVCGLSELRPFKGRDNSRGSSHRRRQLCNLQMQQMECWRLVWVVDVLGIFLTHLKLE